MPKTTKGIVLAVVIGFLAAIVITGKWNLLFFGMLFLCPLMHLFGHNHSGHNDESSGHRH